MRHLHGGFESNDRALKNPESCGTRIKFFASIEEGLISDTNPQKGSIGGDPCAHRIQKPLSFHGLNAVIKGADTGQDDALSAGQGLRSARSHHLRTRLTEGFFHAADVSGIVIEKRDHRG